MNGLVVLAEASSGSASINPTILLTWFTCLATMGGLMVAILRWGRKIMQMVEDFNGTQDRPGVPARPGVMQRLQTLDDQVAVIHSEVNYNHGGSIKDAVERMDVSMEAMQIDVKNIHDRLDSGGQDKVQVNVHT